MEYSISKLAKLAGVSTRTLRFYDNIGLLVPARVSSNGYRIYGQTEVNRLQQILFYRELGIELGAIKELLESKDFDNLSVLEEHRLALMTRREQIDILIMNVEKTISATKGKLTMSDKEKFEGFKQNLIDENEKKYGKEIREKYGDETIDASNAKVKNMTTEQYDEIQSLTEELNETLKAAFEIGDPASELAQKTCELHKKWLCFYWKEYSKEAHIGVTRMYVDDPRFTEYYDEIAVGCATFLRDAVAIYHKSMILGEE
ncbi:MAG: MerR family transcriptional regulator [Suipraeoptans sp.]